ncbi:MAG: hypothetical protein IPP19_03845 [Verrucomicrobia bacterium]|nr:hypothetical protein [Verrucomicrobiota bacterium]
MSALTDSNDQPDVGAPAEVRLARLIQAKGCIIYHEDIPDREYPQVRCSIYGAPKTNELFVRLTNGLITVVETAESGVLFPPMADRIFGMDVLDHQIAFGLAERMWETHKTVLLRKT